MQLFISVGGSWKCLEVQLVNGSIPSIGGVQLSDQQIEPALWFKVIELIQQVLVGESCMAVYRCWC